MRTGCASRRPIPWAKLETIPRRCSRRFRRPNCTLRPRYVKRRTRQSRGSTRSDDGFASESDSWARGEREKSMSSIALPLLRRTTCPHCWTAFPPEEVLWISAHSDLLGDPRLGPEQQQRFLPTRFDVEGNALDAKGFACHSL